MQECPPLIHRQLPVPIDNLHDPTRLLLLLREHLFHVAHEVLLDTLGVIVGFLTSFLFRRRNILGLVPDVESTLELGSPATEETVGGIFLGLVGVVVAVGLHS